MADGKRLSIIDTGFLLAEKRETPMHVAGLHLFSLPEGVDEQRFLHGLADELRSTDTFQPPFGDRLKVGRLGLLGPAYWQADETLDIDYHVRHSALPKPGRYRELFALVSRLHGQMLDRNRPLWELHLIEGLQDGQFAVYMKFHHAAIDGVGSIHLTQSMYSYDRGERRDYSPLSEAAARHYRENIGQGSLRGGAPLSDRAIRNIADVLKAQFDSGAHVAGALRRIAGAWVGVGGSLAVPFRGIPRSPINTEVDGARRFVAQSWPFARIRAVGKALDGTFNDAILAICSGALRMYLDDQHGLPGESLKAMVPISLRRADDLDSSNAVGAISADLATHLRDPVKRFRAIQASVQAGKEMFGGLSAVEAQVVMELLQLPSLFLGPLGLTSRFPPYSTVISNVPGPREPMYWSGARLEGLYPASIVFDGFALNITLVTYVDKVDFGIVACRRTLPQVQRLIDYLEDALVELEEVTGLRKAEPRAKQRARAKAKSKAGPEPKAQPRAKPKAKPKARSKGKARAQPRAAFSKW
jgi:WS/DGAT/MGAT family acyltransferase